MKASQKARSKTQRVMLFGPPKSGKSQLAAALSSHFNLLWLDLENGHSVIFKLPVEQQDRIELVCLPDTKTYPIAAETVSKILTGQKVWVCEQHGKVNCPTCKTQNLEGTTIELNALGADWILVIDSLTQLANSKMNHLLKNQDELYKPEWSDYRNQGALMDKDLSQIQQAKYNVVVISHETETTMEDGRTKLVPVAGTTSFSRNSAKYFDHVVYCEVKNKKHCFSSATTYSNNILTGSRLDIKIEDGSQPTLLDIFLYGEQNAASLQNKEASAALSTLNELSKLNSLIKK